MTEKLLRGKAPLTMYRGANGAAGGHIYRGGILEANLVDADDAERLVAENFLELVVRKGEQFVLAEDTPTGEAGDPVTVGDNGFPPADEVDNGTVNRDQQDAAAKATAESDNNGEVEAKRNEARSKLAELGGTPDGRSSDAVLVEYLVGKGYDRAEVEKASRSQLKELVASAK